MLHERTLASEQPKVMLIEDEATVGMVGDLEKRLQKAEDAGNEDRNQLEEKVATLEAQMKEKDRTIKEQVKELQEKDTKLQELQDQHGAVQENGGRELENAQHDVNDVPPEEGKKGFRCFIL
ncbi:uncharacterized protein [Amphiura filiformis]|uniref:uncharacterized protein n=1 Tax=Amphiura filiformis TaxID=82378 RepID=UPI003B21F2A0